MIDISKLYIVNYCHPNCEPFKNIMCLPKNEAFKVAKKLVTKELYVFWGELK